jgi:hypothetical protein
VFKDIPQRVTHTTILDTAAVSTSVALSAILPYHEDLVWSVWYDVLSAGKAFVQSKLI